MKIKHFKVCSTKIPFFFFKWAQISFLSFHRKKLGKGEQMNFKIRRWKITRGEISEIENRKYRENQ